jgi:hypothetical protein
VIELGNELKRRDVKSQSKINVKIVIAEDIYRE